MNELQGTRPVARVSRVGRLPDPWAWPPWEAQHTDGTFGNRWDDPKGMYRVVYGCSQLEGAYVEVLALFRPDPVVVAELAAIEGPSEEYRLGIVPATWLDGRGIGEATLIGLYADVGDARSLTYLRTVLASRLAHHNIADLDAAAIRVSAPRRFTQEISSHVYTLSWPDGTPRFASIEYESRFGDNYQNWAIFERPDQNPIGAPTIRRLDRGDTALHGAMAMLGLKLAA
jgi:RES domain